MRHPPRPSPPEKIPPVDGILPAHEISGDSPEETALLFRMLEDARGYLSSFSWCSSIGEAYFGGGVSEVFTIFLFQVVPVRKEIGQWIWIIVGDIPPAYLPLEDCRTTREVFDAYVEGMQRWIEFARKGGSGIPADNIPPVNVPPTEEWATLLQKRLTLLKDLIRPCFE